MRRLVGRFLPRRRKGGGLVLGLLLAFSAQAQDPTPVRNDEAPWSSLVLVTSNTGNRCTGVQVAPRLVLTAAHCLVNRRTRQLLLPLSLHVVYGYDRGRYQGHALVAEARVPPGFDAAEPSRTPAADWALLVLQQPGTAPPLALSGQADGAAGALVGFRRDKAHILSGDLDCRVGGAQRHVSGPVLLHDCASIPGLSGAPLLARLPEGWRVAGIHVGHRASGQGIAVPAASLAEALKAAE